MEKPILPALILLLQFNLLSCNSSPVEESDPSVTNGSNETGFSYVVQIKMDDGKSCTGTFISDSLLITAAHCVSTANFVRWNDIQVPIKNVRIHSQWPSPSTGCAPTKPRLPGNDLALVIFPANTFKGKYAEILRREPRVNETVKIVGFGNNEIIPLERYCKIAKSKESAGQCQVLVGDRIEGAKYEYNEVLSFPANVSNANSCSPECPTSLLKAKLAKQELTLKTFVASECGGTLRDRPYIERGVGTKRSGSNRIKSLYETTISVHGGIGDSDDGIDAASGAGDSGGPLFIFDEGSYKIAAVTHGGNVISENATLRKTSLYVKLNADHNRLWLNENFVDLGMPILK